MQKTFLLSAFVALTVPLTLTSCSDEPKVENDPGTAEGKFVISASVQGSNAISYVLLTAESLDG